MGFPGAVWNGWLNPHPNPHGPGNHNDAGNVSHDYYAIGGSGSPGGVLTPIGYGDDWPDSMWYNYQYLNCPETLYVYQGPYDPDLPVHTELEEVLMVCPNFDYGDLGEDYPTIDVESCGPAHPLTDKAWLGEWIDSETKPRILNLDNFDDGVTFWNLPWSVGQLCTVDVSVNGGVHYGGETLYLNAWIDGNLDGDFDDGPDAIEDDPLNYSEWVIMDKPVNVFTGYLCDFYKPGVGTGRTSTIMRFRLTSQTIGRFGYGGYWGGGSSNGWGTYDIDWVLGEVEDYIKPVFILNPVDDLVIHTGFGSGMMELYWTADVAGDYYIYSTTDPNNHGDPRHEPGWATETVISCLPGLCVWTATIGPADYYKNYVIVYETP